MLPVVFGVENIQAKLNQDEKEEPIKIGLLISSEKSLEAKYAAEMAIREANKNAGLNERSFQLITRSMEGPWGKGSNQAVDLVFNEKVWAILGSHDGRNAHLVEQVIAKTHIVFVSAWAADPTLSQAFVPWYFNVVPNNIQQTNLLINEIVNLPDVKKVATISDNEYDSESAKKSFVNALKTANSIFPVQLSYDDTNLNCENLVNQIMNSNTDAVVLFGRASSSQKIIEMMQQKKAKQKIFGALSILGEAPGNHFDLRKYEGVFLVNSGYWLSTKGRAFSTKFMNEYGWSPGPAAAYAYDGVNAIIESIKTNNFKLESLKEFMFRLDGEGVTGVVRFDKSGNRSETKGLVIIKNGSPVVVEK